MKITINEVKKFGVCTSGWRKVLTRFDKTRGRDDPITITEIIDSGFLNDEPTYPGEGDGLECGLWCLRATVGYEREIRLLAVAYARLSLGVLTRIVPNAKLAIDMAESYANGLATLEQLAEVRDSVDAKDLYNASLFYCNPARTVCLEDVHEAVTSTATYVVQVINDESRIEAATTRAIQLQMLREMVAECDAKSHL
jgi:hypothetical protein